jgi:hypothetical protein
VQAGANGGECRGTVSIANHGLQAQGKVWFTAAEVTKFRADLNACYQALSGEATFTTHESNLKVAIVFGSRGQVHIQGAFREPHSEGNELTFRIQTDQSYIAQALEQLAELVKRFEAAS